MKIIGFVEGANVDKGAFGLVGVPHIHKAVAERGHHLLLAIGGRLMPGMEQFVCPNADSVLQSTEKSAFGIVTYPAAGRWAFAPTLAADLSSRVRNVDFIMLHSLYSFPVLTGYVLARRYHKPYGLWLHGVLAPPQRMVSRHKKWVYDRLIARRILEEASVLFYTAWGERDETCPLNLTSPSVIIPYGMNTCEYASLPPKGRFRAQYLSGYEGPLVLYLGRLNAKKGLDLLARAMARVVACMPEVRLAVVGAGDPPDFARQVVGWVRECSLETHAVLTGPIAGLGKKQAFADADIFVLPSQAENFGFAMFEALASRVPVVISDTLNYADEVRRYEAGLVVRRDPREFATAILRLLGDASLRQRMGENGLRLAQAYSWESHGEKVERAIRCILQGQPLPVDLTLNELAI